MIDSDEAAEPKKRFGGGLFSRGKADEFEDLAEELADDSTDPRTGLFASYGNRLIEQTPSDDLADALADDENDEDTAFSDFLSGDDEPDPSRDWLLRPDKG